MPIRLVFARRNQDSFNLQPSPASAVLGRGQAASKSLRRAGAEPDPVAGLRPNRTPLAIARLRFSPLRSRISSRSNSATAAQRALSPFRSSTRVGALEHIAFRYLYSVGTRDIPIAAQWLACALPCRRFTVGLAANDARLGADVDGYSFIVSDFHRLLLASLPAHRDSNS